MKFEELMSFLLGAVFVFVMVAFVVLIFGTRPTEEEVPEPKIIEVTLYDCSE